MQVSKVRIAIAAALLAAGAAALAQGVNQSIDTVLGDHAKYETVIRDLQVRVAAHDAPAVAALVRFPLTVRVAGKKMVLRNAVGFVQNYDLIVTPAIARAITSQRYDELMVNAQGVMFGSGEVWINGVCADKACKSFEPKVVAIQSAPKP